MVWPSRILREVLSHSHECAPLDVIVGRRELLVSPWHRRNFVRECCCFCVSLVESFGEFRLMRFVLFGAFAALGLGLNGCGSSMPARGTSPDAGVPDDPEVVVVVCEPGTGTLPLAAIPGDIFAFRHVDSQCDSLASNFVLRNTSAEPVDVESVGIVSDDFELEHDVLPITLEPGGSFALTLRLVSDLVDTVESSVTISSAAGCVDVPVYGQTVVDGLVSQSAYSIDFGDVVAGTTTDPVEIVLLNQQVASFGEVKLSEFAAAPESFLMAAPTHPTPVDNCDSVTASVSFTAPATPGAVDGRFSWVTLANGMEGQMQVVLLANVVSK